MSEQLERGIEITKLARLLGVEPKEIGYLEQLPSPALHTFRDQVTDRMFASDAGRLRRVAAASTLVPIPLTVKIAQLAFGPVLCAAVAGLLDPKHAVKVASKCPIQFLADITVNMDPRRAPNVIVAVPTPVVVAVAKELLARNEHVTMGRFVSYLSPSTLRASIEATPGNADLLRVAFVMEGKEKLDDLVDIARDRLPGLIRAAYEQDLWAEALDLIGNLSVPNVAEIAELTIDAGEEVLAALVHAALELDAWDVLLPLTAALSPESLRRFAAVPTVHDSEVLRAAIATAERHDLWDAILPLADVLLDGSTPDTVWAALVEVHDAIPDPVRLTLRERAQVAGREDVVAALRYT